MGKETALLKSDLPLRAVRSPPTRVMVVDDSLTVRTALARTIDGESGLEVVCKTSSAELALKELETTPVDVVLLDLEMPGIGGLRALPKILAAHDNIRILVVSSLTQEGAEHSLTALSMGAADTMAKPQSGEFGPAYCDALLTKIRGLGRSIQRAAQPAANLAPPPMRSASYKRPELLAIGASTGGIHALCRFLRQLPREFQLPILVTQHLPHSFMSVFARQLQLAASRPALIAENGMLIESGQIYIAPGTGHLNVVAETGQLFCKMSNQAMPSGCMPSVDPMFSSAAVATNGHTLGIVLSGMGKDGAIGAEELAESGGAIFAQDQDSSAVWGMPRAVAERGLASAILPPEDLARKIMVSVGATPWK